MKVAELRQGLELLSKLLKTWGSTRHSSELADFAEQLSPYDGDTLARLIARLQDRPPSPSSRAAKSAKCNDEVVASYVSNLTAAKSGEDVETLMSKLRSDKKIRVAEARSIAEHLTGAKRSLTKSKALNAIHQFTLQNVREKGVFSSIDRMLGRG